MERLGKGAVGIWKAIVTVMMGQIAVCHHLLLRREESRMESRMWQEESRMQWRERLHSITETIPLQTFSLEEEVTQEVIMVAEESSSEESLNLQNLVVIQERIMQASLSIQNMSIQSMSIQ